MTTPKSGVFAWFGPLGFVTAVLAFNVYWRNAEALGVPFSVDPRWLFAEIGIPFVLMVFRGLPRQLGFGLLIGWLGHLLVMGLLMAAGGVLAFAPPTRAPLILLLLMAVVPVLAFGVAGFAWDRRRRR